MKSSLLGKLIIVSGLCLSSSVFAVEKKKMSTKEAKAKCLQENPILSKKELKKCIKNNKK